ncbi:TIGR02234 family membrane protein [Williamsia sterculiae]|uniref:Trp region conserved hypothetical membrane protein n=1 Tax=Williamsia sterculiae TaxID=1344003 RepID=A0A1N7H5U5_9NOCA|nr:TIGR02234 family membrane protein [Williamsia sterculiae]SIS20219.1 trp region conserved hypothetical membrane protein [Williamsia sterculiae]
MTQHDSDAEQDDTGQNGGTDRVATADRERRRRLGVIALLLAVAAAVLWASSRMTWASLTAADGLAPPRGYTVHGSDWSPWLTPLAIVVVAAIAAAVAVRGWLLRVVAVLVAVIGVVSIVPAISMLTGGANTAYAAKAIDLPGRYTVVSIDHKPFAAVVVIVGGVIAVIAGVLLLRATRTATGMSSRYSSPAARRAELEERVFAERERATTTDAQRPADDDSARDHEPTERMLWDAQDTGADPTSGTPRSRPEGEQDHT